MAPRFAALHGAGRDRCHGDAIDALLRITSSLGDADRSIQRPLHMTYNFDAGDTTTNPNLRRWGPLPSLK